MARRILAILTILLAACACESAAFGQAQGGAGQGANPATLGGDERGQIANELIQRDLNTFVGQGGNVLPIRSMSGVQVTSVNSQYNPNTTFGGGAAGAATGAAALGGATTALTTLSGANNRGFGGVGGVGGFGGVGGVGGNQFGNQFGNNRNQFGGGQFGQGGQGGQFGAAQQTIRARMTTPNMFQPAVSPEAVARFNARLPNLPRIRHIQGIEATVEGRTAVLRGIVPSESDRDLIGRLVMLEPGISDVRNELQVSPPSASSGE